MNQSLRNFCLITANYWGFTITDGALRMLVVLHFHSLGFDALKIAFLFLFYEFFGIVTNLFGGYLGARIGLNATMFLGSILQIGALGLLGVPSEYLSVTFVMVVQAISGIAKDLNKMSAKSIVKVFAKDQEGSLFKWVAILTGSKNALKGFGFFAGGTLLALLGFRGAVWFLGGMLLIIMLSTITFLPHDLGKTKAKPKFKDLFSKTPEINILSAARLFLFGSRDLWFVIALPVTMSKLGFSHGHIGGAMACWVIAYGIVQAIAPRIIKNRKNHPPNGRTARILAFAAAVCPIAIAFVLNSGAPPAIVICLGLIGFGFVFALNSSVHSFLILAYSDHDKVAMNVGFYYMANAAGRLLGTMLSGFLFLQGGLTLCLIASSVFLISTFAISFKLP